MKKKFKSLTLATILVVASTGVYAQFWLTGGNPAALTTDKLGTTSNVNLNIVAGLGGPTRITVKSNNGNVGIGTNTPGARLEIKSGTQGISGLRFSNFNSASALNSYNNRALSVDAIGNVVLVNNSIDWTLSGNSGTIAASNFIGTTDFVDFVARTNSVERMRFTAGGNVGIGTSTPTENLVVSEPAGAIAGTQNFLLVETVVNPFVPSNQGVIIRKDDGQKRGFKLVQDGSDDANSVFKIASFSASSDIDRLTIKRDNGNVGIGTNAPTAKLSVNGTANNTTGAWGVFSDSRVKKVIADFTDGLNVIKQIRTIKFNYNENAPFKAEGEQIGVVAQELEKVAPYMVSKKAMGYIKDLREVNNQAYPFLLINAVKELAAENEELKAQLSAVNARLDALENKTTSSSQNTLKASSSDIKNAHLYQIAPNPFSQKATITFTLPVNTSNAQLLIADATGKTVKVYTLSNGATQQDVYGNNLAAGVYHYSLLVNGKMIDSKQMVITK
jgi:hypothetical protein